MDPNPHRQYLHKLVILLVLSALTAFGMAQPGSYNEAPQLAQRVAAGELPPVEERLPSNPLVVEPIEQIGEYGGTWRGAIVGVSDTGRYDRTIGYDNLVRWARWQPGTEWPDGFPEVLPNIAERWEVNEDATEYTFHLREGMKWSDGHPFTADDIMFWYENVFSNRQVMPVQTRWLMSGGEPVVIEKVDDYTVTFSFDSPHGLLLQWLSTPLGHLPTAYPRHYLEQFHADHNDNVAQLASQEGLADWVALFQAKADRYVNTDLPVLYAWVVTNAGSERIVGERNPYYWKVDPEGNQLPYIDRFTNNIIGETEVQLLNALSGEIDLVDSYVGYVATPVNKPLFIDNQAQGGYRLYDVLPNRMNLTIVSLNMTHNDPVKREVFNNKDFRIGLSHAINREEIIDLVYIGQGRPYQVAERPESTLFSEEMATQYTEYSVDLANEYLDRAGYSERDAEGFRLGPDGRRISIAVEVAGFRPDWIDTLELVADYWREVGVDTQVRNLERSFFNTRVQANEHDAAVWSNSAGVDSVLDPKYIFPFNDGSLFGVLWGYWYQGDSRGEEPPAAARRQMELYDEFQASADPVRRTELMQEIMDIATEEFWAIGIIQPTTDYGIATNQFRNIPEVMLASWLYPHPGPMDPAQFFISSD